MQRGKALRIFRFAARDHPAFQLSQRFKFALGAIFVWDIEPPAAGSRKARSLFDRNRGATKPFDELRKGDGADIARVRKPQPAQPLGVA